MSGDSKFAFRVWLNRDEAGFFIGWVWVVLLAAICLWAVL